MYPDSYEPNPFHPQAGDFELIKKDDNSGFGIICHRAFKKGDLVAVLAGEIIHDIRQHSLQIAPGVHLYDTHFSGYFLHSCAPNVHLDMENLRVYAVADIEPGDYILMDYAQTEDVLYRQFPCACGAVNCRGWITGRKQAIDESDPLYQQTITGRQVAV